VPHDTNTAPPVDCAAVALAEPDPEFPVAAPVPEVVDEVGVRVFTSVEVAFPVTVTMLVTGSEDINVGIAIETTVAFPNVRIEVGMVASGDAVRGSLARLQISAMAPKIAEELSVRGRARNIVFVTLRRIEQWQNTRDASSEAVES